MNPTISKLRLPLHSIGDKNAFKLCASFLLILYSVSVMVIWLAGSLYPYLHITLLLATCTLLLYTFSIDSIIQGSILIVSSSIVARMIIFQHPESLIKVDPDQYAYWAQILANSGRIEAMGLDFYEAAPVFLLNTGIVSIITSLATPDSFSIYPLLGGTVFPLTAAALMKWLPRQTTNQSIFLAMTLASVSPTLFTFSYRPIAQFHATFIWLTFFLLFILYFHSNYQKNIIIAAICVLIIYILAITHKLPPTILFIIFIVFSAYQRIVNKILDDSNMRPISPLLLLSGFIVMLQMIYMTDFFGTAIMRVQRLTSALSGGGGETYVPSEAIYAIPGTLPNLLPVPNTSLTVLIFERSYMMFLLLFAGFAYFILFTKHYDDSSLAIILSVIAVTVSLTIIGTGGVSGLNPSRTLLLGEVFLIAIISWVVVHRNKTRHLWTILIWTVVGVFITTQIFTAVIAPEYENNPRYYLESDEVNAKLFGCQYIDDTVHTDLYYAQEAYIQSTYCDRYSALDRGNPPEDPPPLYEGTVLEQEYDYIAHRTSVDVYEGQHTRYQLTWEPEPVYNSNYDRIYDNNGVSMFSGNTS